MIIDTLQKGLFWCRVWNNFNSSSAIYEIESVCLSV